MSWDQIRTLGRAGMQIGCHTITHPCLTRVKNDESLHREILGARTLIEERVGVPVTTFAYPFGQYNERVAAMVKEAGFTSARSTWPGVLHCQEGLFSLTGLLQTESTQDLVASLDASLAEARQKAAGTATHAG
jgi:peptidoglycan/xylan/chitin deacetylase (PgdA/CDA1 family)